ncbi:MAG: MFS transporter [Halioglobus sp.]
MSYRPLQAGLILAVSLHAFDELVITIALPTIARELGGGDLYGISLASYILAALISVVWAGKSIDRRGPLRIFLIGYGLFAIGLLMATQASTMWEFIAARFVQGLGGGVSWTVAYAITNIVIPRNERPRMVAWLDSAWLIPSILAPTVGGYVVDYLDWHWIFTGQLPFLIVAVCLLYPHLKKLDKEPHPDSGNSRMAIWGALRIALGAGVFVAVLSQPLSWLWLLLLPLSIAIAWRPFTSVMPAGFIHARRGLAAAVLLHFLVFFAFYTAEMYMPLMMIDLRGISSSVTGLAFTSCAFAWIGSSFLQAWLSTRISVYRSLMAGIVLTFIGVASTAAQLIPAVPFWLIYISWAIAGAGMGMAFNTVVTATMNFTREGEEGATSTANGIAGSLSIGLAGGLGGAIINHGEYAGAGLADALGIIWLIAGFACLLCLWVTVLRFKPLPQ